MSHSSCSPHHPNSQASLVPEKIKKVASNIQKSRGEGNHEEQKHRNHIVNKLLTIGSMWTEL